MKKNILVSAALLVSLVFGYASAGKDHELKPILGTPEFQNLKKLVGTWEGVHKMGDKEVPATLEYKVTSNGSALVEMANSGMPHEMISIFSETKGKISMTHYCAIGNQPVMDLKKAKDGVYHFNFAKKKNTINPKKDWHMHSLKVDLIDDNTMKHHWTSIENGKKTEMSIQFTRKE